jgi:hypothetical protein
VLDGHFVAMEHDQIIGVADYLGFPVPEVLFAAFLNGALPWKVFTEMCLQSM